MHEGIQEAHILQQLSEVFYFERIMSHFQAESVLLFRGYGAHVIECAPTMDARETTCAAEQKRSGATFVPPYNAVPIIAGQGTIGLEFLRQVCLALYKVCFVDPEELGPALSHGNWPANDWQDHLAGRRCLAAGCDCDPTLAQHLFTLHSDSKVILFKKQSQHP